MGAVDVTGSNEDDSAYMQCNASSRQVGNLSTSVSLQNWS
jgi:hypothetical protein